MSTWYPASAPYPTAVAPLPWRRPAGPAKALRVLLVLTALALALELFAYLVRRSAYDNFRDGGGRFSTLDNADSFLGLATLLVGGLTIAVFVLTIVWQWRLAKNHQMLGRPDTALGPGWAIGGWFIPLANFVLPFLQIRDLWKGSEPGLTPNSYEWKHGPVAPVLWVWWAAFVGSYVVEWGNTFQLALSSDATFDDEPSLGGTLAAALLRIVAAVLFCVVVGRLTERQANAVTETQSHAVLTPGWPVAPTPLPLPTSPAAWPGGARSPVPLAPPPDLAAGWKPDPTGRASYRYWDGSRWTQNAATKGQAFTCPL